MATDVPLNSPQDSSHSQAWLAEQRRTDQAGLGVLTRSIEVLRAEVREQGTILSRLTGGSGQATPETRGVYETLTQLKEHIALIERALEDHFNESSRAQQVETVQNERETRQIAVVLQQVEELGRVTQASQGRIAALAEELRHERQERGPIGQSLENLQRTLASLQNRLLIVEDQTRRYASYQAATEQSIETQHSDLTRFEQQQKLLDLRVAREVADVQQNVAAMQAKVDDQLKPIAGILRQFAIIDERLERTDQNLAMALKNVEAMRVEIGQVDAQVKTDRVSTGRLRGEIEAQNRKIEEADGAIAQLAERLDDIGANVQDLRSTIDLAHQRLDRIDRELGHIDEVRQQFDSALTVLQSTLRAHENEIRVQGSEIRSELSNATADILRRFEADRRTSVEHRKRTLVELQRQLGELDKGGN